MLGTEEAKVAAPTRPGASSSGAYMEFLSPTPPAQRTFLSSSFLTFAVLQRYALGRLPGLSRPNPEVWRRKGVGPARVRITPRRDRERGCQGLPNSRQSAGEDNSGSSPQLLVSVCPWPVTWESPGWGPFNSAFQQERTPPPSDPAPLKSSKQLGWRSSCNTWGRWPSSAAHGVLTLCPNP